MKLLLRQFGDGCYVWKNGEMEDETHFIVDGKSVRQTDVVSISRDNRSKFVKCSACGATLKNTEEAIKEHRLKGTTSATCIGCRNLRESDSQTKSIKYVLQDDGSYVATIKKEMKLMCRRGWCRSYDINSKEARDGCQYKCCIDARMDGFKDIFMKYPGIFDDIITVDRILDAGFKERNQKRDGTALYTLKGRDNIVAIVNAMNIVDYFQVSRYSNSWTVVYSKKYNEFYKIWNGTYSKWNPAEDVMPHETMQRIKDKIVSLYA
jgi:hypothetical protein